MPEDELEEKQRREGQRNLAEALLLAAWDMEQAVAAARALESETKNLELMWALETAVAVCYARPFSRSERRPKRLPEEYQPTDERGRELHTVLYDLRRKTYAHTDKASGRKAELRVYDGADGSRVVKLSYEWLPFPREWIDPVVQLCSDQRSRFIDEATRIIDELGIPLKSVFEDGERSLIRPSLSVTGHRINCQRCRKARSSSRPKPRHSAQSAISAPRRRIRPSLASGPGRQARIFLTCESRGSCRWMWTNSR